MEYLKKSPQFTCYTDTRFVSHQDHGTHVTATTETGQTIRSKALVMATCVPLNMIQIIAKVAFYRTYCIALRAPKGSYPDQLIYTNADPYIYVKKTAHYNPQYELIIVGGEDHKVGIESTAGYESHFRNLELWTRKMFPYVGEVEYQWSGQIIEPNDYMAFIGRDSASNKNVYIATGDSGNGLTHGIIASRIIPDLIEGVANPWADLYSPSRQPKPRTIPDVITENVKQQVAGYGRYVSTDVSDIEDIPRCSGAVMRAGITSALKPVAVYKDEAGKTFTFSAVCPHLHGVIAWNATEKSWDCPGMFLPSFSTCEPRRLNDWRSL